MAKQRWLSLAGILVLLASAAALLGAAPPSPPNPPGPPDNWEARPPYRASHLRGEGQGISGSTSYYEPRQVRRAYGFDLLSNDGSGQIIGIVDAFDDPTAASDLQTFINNFSPPLPSMYGLPGTASCTVTAGPHPCFQKVYAQGSKPRTDGGWAIEISLDVQWAHAIAPGADILLVEASTNSFSNLLGAVDVAVNNGAKVVSMSWGGNEFSSESSYDFHFNKTGVVFTAASGDSGHGNIYPAVSPYVVGVGGTTLPLDLNGNLTGVETAWSDSGGGISAYEAEPGYQSSFPIPNTGGKRGNPDVSYDANPNTAFLVYDSTPYLGFTGWWAVGGTSAGAPQWAALVVLADQALSGALSSNNLSSSPIYNAGASTVYTSNYRDITSGTNGSCGSVCTATSGYDFVTGLGSPLANNLVPYLVNSAPTTQLTLAFGTAPQVLTAGSPSGPMAVQLQSSSGVLQTPTSPVAVSLSSSSAQGTFAASLSGPWTATLTVTIAAGSSTSGSFYYQDTKAGNPTLTASATGYSSGTQTETVNPGPLASISVAPSSATVTVGGTQSFTASGADAYGNPIIIASANWSVSPVSLGTVSPVSGNPTVFTANSTTTGSGTVTATVGSVSGNASVAVASLSAPSNLTAKQQGNHISLTWTSNSSGVTFNLYRGTSSGGEVLYAAGLTSTAANDFGVTSGVMYYYQVTAVTQTGVESARSNEASAKAK